MAATTVIFDAYGTLFDVTAAARAAAQRPEFPDLARSHAELSRIWREKQVGYSWWRAVTGEYKPFWDVTADALDYALDATGLSGDPALRTTLMELYAQLDAYPEVPAMLNALRAAGRRTAILSNGSPEMLAAATASAGVADALDAVISVDTVQTFKPAARVYDLVGARFGTAPRDVLFVSSNGWDAAAAAGYGFDTVWVNRASLPPDRLPHRPARTLPDLTTIPEIATGAPA
ncbi:MAG: haloacid dehalogenase type II [Pseudomonadota bacterium]